MQASRRRRAGREHMDKYQWHEVHRGHSSFIISSQNNDSANRTTYTPLPAIVHTADTTHDAGHTDTAHCDTVPESQKGTVKR